MVFVGSFTCWLMVGNIGRTGDGRVLGIELPMHAVYMEDINFKAFLATPLIKFCGWTMWPFVLPLMWF